MLVSVKENIRYLHESDPNEWTVEHLAKVYPVGIQSIRKILKSRIRLWKPQDILQNDLHVKRNWELILSQLKNNDIDKDSNVVGDFLENVGYIESIDNALHVVTVSDSTALVSKPYKHKEGIFSAIVSDELKNKQIADEHILGQQKQLYENLSSIISEIKSILKDLTEVKQSKYAQKSHLKNSPHIASESLRDIVMSKLESYNNCDLKNISLKDDVKDVLHKPIKKREAPREIALPQDTKLQNYSYRVDDSVYDENGEFLYRLPS